MVDEWKRAFLEQWKIEPVSDVYRMPDRGIDSQLEPKQNLQSGHWGTRYGAAEPWRKSKVQLFWVYKNYIYKHEIVRQRYSSTYVKRWREPKSRTNSRAISILHFVGEKFARALTMVLSVSQISGTFHKSLKMGHLCLGHFRRFWYRTCVTSRKC